MTYPTHIVANERGTVFTYSVDGPFTLETATKFADEANRVTRPEYRTWKVFALVEPEDLTEIQTEIRAIQEVLANQDTGDSWPWQ